MPLSHSLLHGRDAKRLTKGKRMLGLMSFADPKKKKKEGKDMGGYAISITAGKKEGKERGTI